MRKAAHTLLAATLALALVGGTASAQAPSIRVEVDQEIVNLHDELKLSFNVQGQYENFEPPKLDGFTVVDTGITRILNGRQNLLTHRYTLRPKKVGQLVVGSAKLWLGNKVIAQSRPLTVKVIRPKPKPPTSFAKAAVLTQSLGQGAFVRYKAPKGDYYVGEPFALELEVYARSDLRISGLETMSTPSLDGLLVEELATAGAQRKVEKARVGNDIMNYYVVSQQLAIPLRRGRILIDAATVRVGLRRGLLGNDIRVSRISQPFWINVKPVPTEGRPAGYKDGNIGRFTVSMSLVNDQGKTPTQIVTGERMVMRVEVRGEGNLAALSAPSIQAEDVFEIKPLPTGDDDAVVKSARGMTGGRTFQYLVRVLRPGEVEIPTAVLVSFDPVAGAFSTRREGGGRLTVTGDAITDITGAASSSGESVRPLIETATLSQGHSGKLSDAAWFWLLLALPFFAFLFVEGRHWARRRRDRDPDGQRARSALAIAKKRLRAAEQAQRDGLVKDFYGQIARTLTGYLEDRANIPATGMTHDQLSTAAVEAGYPRPLVDAAIVEMENCDFARFAPSESATNRMRETRERAGELLTKLDATNPTRRP
ncbi:MAG: hypothetical protein ACI9MR_002066 [Myxococcota bacterium]